MLQNIDYIFEVYKERSFSRAAQNLYISQSSLSQTIRHAETRIGMDIFDRSSHPISLTEFGELYIRAAEEIFGIVNNLENYVYDVNQSKSGHLSIGVGNFFATYLVPPVIVKFKETHPNVQINLMEGRTMDLVNDLNKGNLDLLVSNGQLDTSLYHKTILFQEHMVLSVPKHFFENPPHPESLLSSDCLLEKPKFDRVPAVELKSFAHIPFILLRPGNDARLRADQMFSAEKLKPQILLEPDQTATAFGMSRNGMGATIIDDVLVQALGNYENVWLYKLPSTYAIRDVAVFNKKSGHMTRSMKDFIQLLQSNV